MLHHTRGIVFNSIPYGESSIIVRIYTETFGVQSYIINSVRKKNAKIHANFFQPLTPLDLVVYHKERGGLQRISEVKASPPLVNIPFDIVKSSMTFFIDEVLAKSVHEEEANPELFDFIFNSIIWLDGDHPCGNDFHLLFLMKLTKYLGFFPVNNFSEERNIFNLREGQFQFTYPEHSDFIPPPLSRLFSSLIEKTYSFSPDILPPDRRQIINYLLDYFSLHLEGFGNIKSHKVLEQVWENN